MFPPQGSTQLPTIVYYFQYPQIKGRTGDGEISFSESKTPANLFPDLISPTLLESSKRRMGFWELAVKLVYHKLLLIYLSLNTNCIGSLSLILSFLFSKIVISFCSDHKRLWTTQQTDSLYQTQFILF